MSSGSDEPMGMFLFVLILLVLPLTISAGSLLLLGWAFRQCDDDTETARESDERVFSLNRNAFWQALLRWLKERPGRLKDLRSRPWDHENGP